MQSLAPRAAQKHWTGIDTPLPGAPQAVDENAQPDDHSDENENAQHNNPSYHEHNHSHNEGKNLTHPYRFPTHR